MKRIFIFLLTLVVPGLLLGQIQGPLKISENQRFLAQSDDSPFFWMADTAWELFHRTNIKEAEYYLSIRKSQGFNVIQAVALAEIDGLNDPNQYGEKPFESIDPNCFNAKELGYSNPDDIRRIMYWNVFAGGAGQTYGCHAVWQMYTLDRNPINGPLKPWQVSLELPMANQVKHLKNLMLSKSYFSRIPDYELVVTKQEDDEHFVIGTRDVEGSYAMIYFPTGKSIEIDFSKLKNPTLKASWYDPRTGVSFPYSGSELSKGENKISTPSSGKGQDWVLVVE